MKKSSGTEIRELVRQLPVFDHHEHAWRAFSPSDNEEYDLPYFLYSGYVSGDMHAAGLPSEGISFAYLNNPELPDDSENVWKLIRPYLLEVRNTSYFRYLLRSLRDLFGISEADIFSKNWKDCSDRLRKQSRSRKDWGGFLCAKMKVRAIVLDACQPDSVSLKTFRDGLGCRAWSELDDSRLRLLRVVRLDSFILSERGLEENLGRHPLGDLDTWLAAFEGVFRETLKAGAAGFKTVVAYHRRIEFSDPPRDEVAGIFKQGVRNVSEFDRIKYQDFMINRLCRLCVEADVPLQIHSGIQAGLANDLENSRPTLLTSLFQRHPELRVDLFHGGYPWYIQAGLMAKYFRGVHVDGCWLPQISPSAYRMALTSWIETVPAGKIFAWGGDHQILAHSYASLLLCKDLVGEVLADFLDRGYFDLELAGEIAQGIFYRNGCRFWRIDAGPAG